MDFLVVLHTDDEDELGYELVEVGAKKTVQFLAKVVKVVE